MYWEAKQIRGNTWCVEMPHATVPYYHLDREHIILLDSGCMTGGELEAWLLEQGLHVEAILNTHDHWDHTSANAGLQQRDGARIYMPKLEAALCSADLGRFMELEQGHYQLVRDFFHEFPYRVDEEIGREDGPLTVCGAEFQVIHTPGHSLDHVAFRTPDDVLYVGDALMSAALLRTAKVNYALNHEEDIKSKEKLRNYRCAAYVLAHSSVEEQIDTLIDQNIAYIRRRADQVLRMIDKPMSMEEITRLAWREFSLKNGPYLKDLEVSSMIRALVQYLISQGVVETRFYDGVDYYKRCREQEDKA